MAKHTSSEGAAEHPPLTVSFPSAAPLPVDWIGNKGLYLNQLLREQMPVPPTVCITPMAYRLTLQQLGIQVAELPHMSYQELMALGRNIQTRLLRQPLPTVVFEALQQLWRGLNSGDADSLVLRPSMPYHPAHDFARRLRPILNIRGLMELERALKLAWAYLWTEDVLYYRCYHGHQTQRHDDLALLVQVQVPSEVSGSLLNFQPAHAGSPEYVIESAWGFNESVTRGLLVPDHFVCSPGQTPLRSLPGDKKIQLTVGKEGAMTEQPLPEARHKAVSLTPAQLQALIALGQRCSQLLHQAPLEVEWTLAREQCFILQLTPVDKVHLQAENEAEWLRAESFAPLLGGTFSPLGWSLLAPVLESAARTALHRAGVNAALPGSLFHMLRAQVYIHQSLTTALQQRVAALTQTYQAAPRKGLRQAVRNFLSEQKFWHQRLHTFELSLRQLWDEDLMTAAPESLLSHLDQALGALQTFLEGYLFVLLKGQDLRACLQAAWQERAHQSGAEHSLPAFERLLGALDNRTAQSARMLDRWVQQLEAEPALKAIFDHAPEIQLRDQLDACPQGQAFLAQFQKVVGLVGVPEISADPLSASWVEDLRLALQQLRRHRTSPLWDEALAVTQAEDFRALLATCTWPEERLLWRLLLPLLRQYLGIGQDLPFYIATVQPLLRQILLALARHLPLERPEAVFYLTQAELRHLLQTPLNAYKIDELHELVQARQLEQQIISRVNHPQQPPLAHIDLQGLPAHGGRYFGRLRIVRTTADLEALRHGDILVTDYFEPHWEPAFAKIAGLITELGGVTSHGARLARQYHVPAITGIAQACQRLKTGQVVNLNGFTGQVQAYQPEALAALRRA